MASVCVSVADTGAGFCGAMGAVMGADLIVGGAVRMPVSCTVTVRTGTAPGAFQPSSVMCDAVACDDTGTVTVLLRLFLGRRDMPPEVF